ncbi:outer dense fiber of sperm tails 4 [Rhinolophus ferrumequinum]|uniref:Outer dense fiber of sperm tails 4 n=1 Tax=Rhinolophus ferrumequinum TaxID=59479 RepID=A0A7J7TF16_RHIFE|nr:outer dense fiber of sperm tails 4 [Rhinolophus ferrumequinum]
MENYTQFPVEGTGASLRLSLIAFILLLVVVFSKNWLYLSKIRLHQRWPMNVSNRISMSARIMSIGLLQICKSKSCSNSETGKAFFFYFNNKNFWSLILSHPSDTMSCSSSSRSDSLNEKIVPNTLVNQEEVLDLEQEKASL